ncbi:hypothetical protein DL96DRAFT_856927 [Flagelloscypha sp. PMI_526]|nr:hypothetical protein DL96DRAFT_856927 [Flagelloscypha sp. PMI_526]
MAEGYTVQGSCLCKSIQFVAKGVDFSNILRCNCSICERLGRTSVRLKSQNRIFLLDEDKKETPVDTENIHSFVARGYSLVPFVPFPEKRVVGEDESYHCFCKKCGTHVFTLFFYKPMGGHSSTVNVCALDVESIGKSMKELTRIENMTYVDGRETFGSRKGEPWDFGSW